MDAVRSIHTFASLPEGGDLPPLDSLPDEVPESESAKHSQI